MINGRLFLSLLDTAYLVEREA
ncbi:hypothetical protein [Pyrococcus yayanosii]